MHNMLTRLTYKLIRLSHNLSGILQLRFVLSIWLVVPVYGRAIQVRRHNRHSFTPSQSNTLH